MTTPMAAEEYRLAIAHMGLNQRAASDWLGVSPRTGRAYATGSPIPMAVAILLRLMIAGGMTPSSIRAQTADRHILEPAAG